jgi:hypothetical protein
MVNPAGLGGAANKIAEQALSKVEEKPPEADSGASSAFQKAMHQQDGADPSSTNPVQGTAAQEPQVEGAKPPGDRILERIDGMRSDAARMGTDSAKLLEDGEMSPQDMMKLKMEIDQISFEQQMTLKGTTTVENDVKQLLKQQ